MAFCLKNQVASYLIENKQLHFEGVPCQVELLGADLGAPYIKWPPLFEVGKERDATDLWEDVTEPFPAFQGHIHWVVTHQHDPFITDYYVFVSTVHQTVIKGAQALFSVPSPGTHEGEEPCGKRRSWRHTLRGSRETAKQTLEFQQSPLQISKASPSSNMSAADLVCGPQGTKGNGRWVGTLAWLTGENVQRRLTPIFNSLYALYSLTCVFMSCSGGFGRTVEVCRFGPLCDLFWSFNMIKTQNILFKAHYELPERNRLKWNI